MNPRSILIGFGCCALLSVPALAQSTGLSTSDKEFMKIAAQSDMTEAHLGQVAQDQASQADLKDFGRTLAQDYTNAYNELTELANKTGETIPKGIDVYRNKALAHLIRLKGNTFDHPFLRREIQDHKLELARFKREAARGQDPDVKAYASKMIPTLEEQLHKARALAKSEKHTS